MPQQSVQNLNEYHSVFADSLIAIINKLAIEEGQAKKIMIFNIRQAYILYRMDTPEQRMFLDNKLITARNDPELVKKNKGVIDYDYILKEELDAMTLDKLLVEDLEIKMFTYMTLAGIKPVQNSQQRASGFQKFVASTAVR